MRREWLALALALTVVACGGDDPPASEAPAPTEVATQAPTEAPTTPPDNGSTSTASPAVNSIAVDPGDGTVMVGSGPALFRIAPGSKQAEQVTGQITTPQGNGTVGGNLVLAYAGPGDLLGSGHPEQEGPLPENLGLIRSGDQGDTWASVSGLGDGDYHELEVVGDQIVAVNVESPDILVSRDGGQTWETRTPPAVPIDVVVDPGDPQRWAVSTEQGTFISGDGGNSWRPRDTTFGARLAWPAPDKLYSFDRNGKVRLSDDGGRSWEDRGDIGGLTSVVAAGQMDELYAAVVGGKVRSSRDGGATWSDAATLG